MPPYNQYNQYGIYQPQWRFGNPDGYQSPYSNIMGLQTLAQYDQMLGDARNKGLAASIGSMPQTPAQTQYGAWGAIEGKVGINSAAANTANKLSSPGAQMGYAAASMVGNAISDISDNAIRRNASDNAVLADAVGGNSWGDVFTSGSKMAAARANINANQINYSDVGNNQNLLNAWNASDLQSGVQKAHGWQTAGSIGGSVLADAAAGASIGSAVPVIGCVCAGTEVFTNTGKIVKIEDLTKEEGIIGWNDGYCLNKIYAFKNPEEKECVEITTSCGRTLRCSIDHPIYKIPKQSESKKWIRITKGEFVPAEQLKIGDKIGIINEIPLWGSNELPQAYIIGMLIGDGSYDTKHGVRLFSGDSDTWTYLEQNNVSSTYTLGSSERYKKEFRTYRLKDFSRILKKLGILNQSKERKTLPVSIEQYNKASICKLIAGLFDTDGCINIDKTGNCQIFLSQSNLSLIKEVQNLFVKLGINSRINVEKSGKFDIKGRTINRKVNYRLTVKDNKSIIKFYENIHLNIKYKQERLNKCYDIMSKRHTKYSGNFFTDKIKSITYIGRQLVYNLQADDSHTYIANHIITHNTAVGAIAGAISGLGRGVISAFQHNSNANDINAAVKRANEEQVRNFYDTAENNSQKQLRTGMRNYFQQGGYLQPDNGVTLFENGGSHQQNPLGGIPQGIATDGLPNLVEEGEVKYKDYIYTKRSKPSKALLKKYSLPEKYVGKTFAEIAMTLQKASEDRPNDSIALTTLQEMMARLQGSQEEYKAKQEEHQLARAFDKLSTEEKAGIAQIAMQQQAAQEEQTAQAEQAQVRQQPEPMDIGAMQFAQGGKIHIDPSKTSHWHQVGGDLYSIRQLQSYTNKGRAGQTLPYTPNDPTFKYWDAKGVNGYDAGYWAFANNIANYAKDSKLRRSLEAYYKDRGFNAELTDDIIRTQATNGKAGGFHDIMAQAYADSLIPKVETPVQSVVETPITVATPTPTVQTAPSETIIDNTPLGTVKDDWRRAAPIIGSGIGAIAALATPADMTYANRMNNLAASYQPIAPQLLGGYRRYNPYDINLANAEATAQATAMQRANRANTNRGTQTANAIALENAYERQNATRNLAWQQANEERRAGVDAYYLGIDKINAGTVQRYDDLNSQIRDKRVAMQAASAQAADQATTLRSQNISTASTNLFNSLGAYGKERMGINMINQATKDQVLKNLWLIASAFEA